MKVDAFDQQFNDAGLFGWEQLIPNRLELLSLRQLGRSRLFSAQGCWQLSPVFAAISDFNSRLLIGRVGSFFSDGSFLSGALGSADSVRFAKFECFERLMSSNEMGFL